jgi:hypothetical protein
VVAGTDGQVFNCEFGDGFEAIELTYLASCSMLS